jgi:hypothetical protein
VLIAGWGVPMPIPVRSRRLDQLFWEDILGDEAKAKNKDSATILKQMGY